MDRARTIAFRLDGHNLSERVPRERLVEAVGAVGLQNTPPGSAALGIAARVEGVAAEDVERALLEEKTLLQVWSRRSAAFLVATEDAAVFTLGLLPDTDEGLTHFMEGVGRELKRMKVGARAAVDAVEEAARDAFEEHEVLTKRGLGEELRQRLPEPLRALCEPDVFSRFGAHLVRPVALRGVFCFAPRSGSEASFIRTDRWLGSWPQQAPADEARAELVRRYLHCYAPSNGHEFADWAGISAADAHRSWSLVKAEIADGVLAVDHERVARAALPKGLRLLPPYDVYVAQRDRQLLVPESELRKRIYPASGNPGTILFDGEIVGTWRQQRAGRRLQVSVDAKCRPRLLRDELARLGAFLGVEIAPA